MSALVISPTGLVPNAGNACRSSADAQFPAERGSRQDSDRSAMTAVAASDERHRAGAAGILTAERGTSILQRSRSGLGQGHDRIGTDPQVGHLPGGHPQPLRPGLAHAAVQREAARSGPGRSHRDRRRSGRAWSLSARMLLSTCLPSHTSGVSLGVTSQVTLSGTSEAVKSLRDDDSRVRRRHVRPGHRATAAV